jgi:hypothetical protein
MTLLRTASEARSCRSGSQQSNLIERNFKAFLARVLPVWSSTVIVIKHLRRPLVCARFLLSSLALASISLSLVSTIFSSPSSRHHGMFLDLLLVSVDPIQPFVAKNHP